MKSKKMVVSLAVLALTLGTGGVVSAYGRDKTSFSKSGLYRQEMLKIFENKDYDTWHNMMNETADKMIKRAGEIKNRVTQENFNKMIKAHELIHEGDKEGAMEMMRGLNFGTRSMGNRGLSH